MSVTLSKKLSLSHFSPHSEYRVSKNSDSFISSPNVPECTFVVREFWRNEHSSGESNLRRYFCSKCFKNMMSHESVVRKKAQSCARKENIPNDLLRSNNTALRAVLKGKLNQSSRHNQNQILKKKIKTNNRR